MADTAEARPARLFAGRRRPNAVTHLDRPEVAPLNHPGGQPGVPRPGRRIGPNPRPGSSRRRTRRRRRHTRPDRTVSPAAAGASRWPVYARRQTCLTMVGFCIALSQTVIEYYCTHYLFDFNTCLPGPGTRPFISARSTAATGINHQVITSNLFSLSGIQWSR